MSNVHEIEENFVNMMVRNSGYATTISNVIFLLQMRVSKYFRDENCNDVQFSHYFLKLYKQLSMIEQDMMVDTGGENNTNRNMMQFTTCLKDVFETVTDAKFQDGIRVPPPRGAPPRRHASDFRIRSRGRP